MSSIDRRRFSDSHVARERAKLPTEQTAAAAEKSRTRGAFETIGRQLELEEQLHVLFQQLLQSYKETQQWACVGQIAQGLVASSQRVGQLKLQLERLREDSRALFLESISERSLPLEQGDQEAGEQAANADDHQSPPVIDTLDEAVVACEALLEEASEIPAKPDVPVDASEQESAEQPTNIEQQSGVEEPFSSSAFILAADTNTVGYTAHAASADSDQTEEEAGVNQTAPQESTNVESSTAAVKSSEELIGEESEEVSEGEQRVEDNSIVGPTEGSKDKSPSSGSEEEEEEAFADAQVDVITTAADHTSEEEAESTCKQEEDESVELKDKENTDASLAVSLGETSISARVESSGDLVEVTSFEDQLTAAELAANDETQLESEVAGRTEEQTSNEDVVFLASDSPSHSASPYTAVEDHQQSADSQQHTVGVRETEPSVVSSGVAQSNAGGDDLAPTTSVSSIDKEFGLVDECLDELTSEIEALITVSELSSETSEQFFSPPESITVEPEYDYSDKEESVQNEEVEKRVILADPLVVPQQGEEEAEEGSSESGKDFEIISGSFGKQLGDLEEDTVQEFESVGEELLPAVADSNEEIEKTDLDLPTVDSDLSEQATAETGVTTEKQASVEEEEEEGEMEPPNVDQTPLREDQSPRRVEQLPLKFSVRLSIPSSLSDENKPGTDVYVIDAASDENGQSQPPIMTKPVQHRLEDFVWLHQELARLGERSKDGREVVVVPKLNLDICSLNGSTQENGLSTEGERIDAQQVHSDKSIILELFLNEIANNTELLNESIVVNFLTTPTPSIPGVKCVVGDSSASEAEEGVVSLKPHLNGEEEQEPAEGGDEMEQNGEGGQSQEVCSTEQESTMKEEMPPSSYVPDAAAPSFNEEEEPTQEEREQSPHVEVEQPTRQTVVELPASAEDPTGEAIGHENQEDLAGQPTGEDQPSHGDQSNQPSQSNQPQEPDSESTLQDKVSDDSESTSMNDLLNKLEAITAVSESEEAEKDGQEPLPVEIHQQDISETQPPAANVDQKEESSTNEYQKKKKEEGQSSMEAAAALVSRVVTGGEEDAQVPPGAGKDSLPTQQEATQQHQQQSTPSESRELSPLPTSLPPEAAEAKEEDNGGEVITSTSGSGTSSPLHKEEGTTVCDERREASVSPSHEIGKRSSFSQDDSKQNASDDAPASLNDDESDFSPTHSVRTSSNATTSSYLYTTDESLSPVKSVGQAPPGRHRTSSDPSLPVEETEVELSEQHDAFHMSLMPGQSVPAEEKRRKMKRKGSMPLKQIKSSINNVKRSFSTKKRGNTIGLGDEATKNVSILKPLTTQEWDPTCLLEELYADYKQGVVTTVNPSGEAARHYGYLDKLPTNRTKANLTTKWKRRYFRAQEGNIYYYQDRTATKALGFIHLTSARVVPIPEKMQLQIVPKDGKSIMLKAPNVDEYQTWHRALLLEAAHPTPIAPSSPKPVLDNPTVIIDIGACSVRAGLVREDPYPEIFFPAVCSFEDENFELIECGHAALLPDNRLRAHQVYPRRVSLRMDRHRSDVNLPLRGMEGIVSTIMMLLDVDPQVAQLIMTLPPTTPEKERDELVEMLLGTVRFAGICLQDQTQLALFSYNSTTGIIVDIGNHITVVPYIDGYAIEAGITRLPYGGNAITESLAKLVTQKGLRYFSETEMLINRFIKESLCYVSCDYEGDSERSEGNPKDYLRVVEVDRFQLPDHRKMVTLDSALFKAPEGLFSPHVWGKDVPGLHEIVWKAIQACPIDQRRELSKKIYLSGASSVIPGLKERLQKELTSLSPTGVAVEVHANDTCHHAAYCGASVLASLGSFQNYLVSLDDWTVAGAEALRKWSGS